MFSENIQLLLCFSFFVYNGCRNWKWPRRWIVYWIHSVICPNPGPTTTYRLHNWRRDVVSDVEVHNTVVPARQHDATASDAELLHSVEPAPAEASPPAAVAPQNKTDTPAPAVAAAPQPDVDADAVAAATFTEDPGVELALVSTEPQRLNTWTLSQQDKDTIDAATSVTDVPAKLRNKVYAAIARAITQAKAEQIYMPPAVIARYDEASANRGLLAARFPCLFSIYLIV